MTRIHHTLVLLFLFPLGGCDDVLIYGPGGGDEIEGEGWCAVQSVFANHCVSCHSGESAPGNLDLRTAPHGALVDQPSDADATLTLVTPSSPELSFLMNKLTGDLTESQGGRMPPGRTLPDAQVDIVRQWIAEGADNLCDGPVDDPVDGYHPEGFSLPENHGPAAKLQTLQCIECHGADLTGDTGVSCDTCHSDGWRTDCLFCHGGGDNETGAPPRNSVSPAGQERFNPHTAHVEDTALHNAFDCSTCHVKPDNILSPGHLFVADTTPGQAEVSMTQGLSAFGQFDGNGTCSNLYCHGDRGQDNGRVSHTASATSCDSCHPDASSGRDAWDDQMSGEHEDHLREGLRCQDCHSGTTSNGTSIANTALHVNGTVDVALPTGMTRTADTCTGSCHGENHRGRDWN